MSAEQDQAAGAGAFGVFRGGKEGQQYDYLGRMIPPYEDSTRCSSMGAMLAVHKACWLPAGLAGCAYQYFTSDPHAISTRMLLMTGLFGAYGIAWVLKSNIYPDLNFYNGDEGKITGVGDWIFKFVMIGIYFIYPITAALNTSPLMEWQVVFCPLLFLIGGFFHWAGDAQRYFQIKFNAGKLITDNFYAHMRHPSYTGEIMMWVALSLMNPVFGFGISWFPLLWLLLVTVVIGVPGKEKRLSRYPEWEEYKARTPMLWPNPLSFGRVRVPKPTTELLATSA